MVVAFFVLANANLPVSRVAQKRDEDILKIERDALLTDQPEDVPGL